MLAIIFIITLVSILISIGWHGDYLRRKYALKVEATLRPLVLIDHPSRQEIKEKMEAYAKTLTLRQEALVRIESFIYPIPDEPDPDDKGLAIYQKLTKTYQGKDLLTVFTEQSLFTIIPLEEFLHLIKESSLTIYEHGSDALKDSLKVISDAFESGMENINETTIRASIHNFINGLVDYYKDPVNIGLLTFDTAELKIVKVLFSSAYNDSSILIHTLDPIFGTEELKIKITEIFVSEADLTGETLKKLAGDAITFEPGAHFPAFTAVRSTLREIKLLWNNHTSFVKSFKHILIDVSSTLIGGKIGAAAGGAIAGPVGLVVGGLFGGLIGKLIGNNAKYKPLRAASDNYARVLNEINDDLREDIITTTEEIRNRSLDLKEALEQKIGNAPLIGTERLEQIFSILQDYYIADFQLLIRNTQRLKRNIFYFFPENYRKINAAIKAYRHFLQEATSIDTRQDAHLTIMKICELPVVTGALFEQQLFKQFDEIQQVTHQFSDALSLWSFSAFEQYKATLKEMVNIANQKLDIYTPRLNRYQNDLDIAREELKTVAKELGIKA